MTEQEDRRSALPGESYKTPPLPSWTEQEKWVYEQVCKGEIADFNKNLRYGGKSYLKTPDPKDSIDWLGNRILSPQFLETILLHEPYRSSIPSHGVQITGAWFREPIDLSSVTLNHELWLISCRFESTVNLARLKTPCLISFGGSVFTHKVNMDSLCSEASLSMKSSDLTELDLRNAKIGGQLDFERAELNGLLFMVSIEVGSSLFMNNGSKFKEVVLRGAIIKGNLEMDGSKFDSTLDISSIQIGGYINMRKSEFHNINLRGSRIEGNLDMGGSTFKGEVDMNSLTVKEDLFMNPIKEEVAGGITLTLNTMFVEKVNLVGAKIRGSIDMRGAIFKSNPEIDGMQVEGDLFMNNVEVSKTHILYLTFCEIGRSLYISGSKLPSLNLSGTKIHKDFYLGSRSSKNSFPSPEWHEGAKLVLRNTEVGAIQDLPDAWPDKLELEGFTYSRLSGFKPENQEDKPNKENEKKSDSKSEKAIDWSEKFKEMNRKKVKQHSEDMGERGIEWFKEWLAKQESYSPQPYEQLATVLRNAGHKDKADKVLYESRERERSQSRSQSRYLYWLWLTALRWVIGYGYSLRYSLFWVIGLVIFGTVLCFTTLENAKKDSISKANGKIPTGSQNSTTSEESKGVLLIHSFWYSVDNFLPVIELLKDEDKVKFSSWGIKSIFYIHRIVGSVLAIYIGAGLSGLTKKQE